MLIILIIWIIVTLCALGYGLLIVRLAAPDSINRPHLWDLSYILLLTLIGFVTINIIATILSLFLPLRLASFLIVVIPALLSLLLNIRSLQMSGTSLGKIGTIIPYKVISLCLMVLLAWITSGAAHNADTYIYHAQSIRWIEEYPVIKGLGNFFIRLAYNSNWFVQSAIFSFSFLGGKSYHVLNGLVVFWISLFFLDDFYRYISENRMEFLPITALLLIPFGFISIGTQASAPSTDLPVVYLGWLIVYLCFRYCWDAENDQRFITVLLAISGLASFAFVIKIYALPLLIFPVLFILFYCRIIQPQTMRTLVVWIMLIFAPWVIRNIIISGYAIYPLSFTAVPVDWRMPRQIVEGDLQGIRVWGFNGSLPPYNIISQSFLEQIEFWFQQLTHNQRILFIVSMLFPAVMAFFYRLESENQPKERLNRLVIFFGAFCSGFLFWLITSPNLRFGTIYLLFFFAATLGMGVDKIIHLINIPSKFVGMVGMVGLFIFEIIFLLITLDPNTFKTRLISPLDYDERYVYPCAINGGDTGIWCASFYGECGYHYFPCHAWGTENVFLYGENFGDGFYIKMSKETP